MLLEIDGLNLVRRIYEAIPGDDDQGRIDGLMKSSLSSIKRALKEVNPTHCVCVFDAPGKNWRHEIYPAYKENRKPASANFTSNLPLVMSGVSSLGINIVSVNGYEAEDVMALISEKWCQKKTEKVCILSTDKDTLQLVNDQVICRNHFTSTWMDDEYVLNKFGVKPSQIGDYLAITGDESDGIPGVVGVGMKTAAKLLNEYGSLDGIMEHSGEIKGKVGIKLKAECENIKTWRKLVTLRTDMKIGRVFSDFELK